MPTSARASLGFFGRFADVGIRAPEQNALLQQALVSVCHHCRCSAFVVHSTGRCFNAFTPRHTFDAPARLRMNLPSNGLS